MGYDSLVSLLRMPNRRREVTGSRKLAVIAERIASVLWRFPFTELHDPPPRPPVANEIFVSPAAPVGRRIEISRRVSFLPFISRFFGKRGKNETRPGRDHFHRSFVPRFDDERPPAPTPRRDRCLFRSLESILPDFNGNSTLSRGARRFIGECVLFK